MTDDLHTERLPPWDGRDVAALLTVEETEADRFCNRFGDQNSNGRSYGGQILGQALMAAALTVADDRPATMLQFLFLQGTLHDRPVDFAVSRLQDGKRFSSRHVRGEQAGGRVVLDAHATFAAAGTGPAHGAAAAILGEPETSPRLSDLPAAWNRKIRNMGGYELDEPAYLECRIPDADAQLDPDNMQARLRYWVRLHCPLGNDARLQAAAFAYLSDFWVSFSCLAPHVAASRPEDGLYVASLNHSIWFHQPFAVGQWLHFDTTSAHAGCGRGLATARVHDRSGRQLATVSQETLMMAPG